MSGRPKQDRALEDGQAARLEAVTKKNKPIRRSRPPVPKLDLSQTTPEELAGILATSTGLDVEPLLLAVRVGLLDDHLDSLVSTVEERVRALETAAHLIALVTLKVGDRVQLGHNLEPLYLHGKNARVIAQDGDKWIVRLEHPVGRFKDTDLRVSASQLATVTNT
jgi:hypothetical protein